MLIGTNVDGFMEIVDPDSFSTKYEGRVTYHDMANGGRTATIFGNLTPARTFDMEYKASRVGEITLLDSMVRNMMWYRRGTGLQMVPPSGEDFNLLTLEDSNLVNNSYYTDILVDTEDGFHLGYINRTDAANMITASGVIPMPRNYNGKVTVSFYAVEPVTVQLWWTDLSGIEKAGAAQILTPTDPQGQYKRVRGTFDAVTGSRGLRVSVKNGDVTKPAVTLGGNLYPWTEGQRLPSVVVEKNSSDMLAQHISCRSPKIDQHTYTVTELRKSGY